jgi:hypothetical protein
MGDVNVCNIKSVCDCLMVQSYKTSYIHATITLVYWKYDRLLVRYFHIVDIGWLPRIKISNSTGKQDSFIIIFQSVLLRMRMHHMETIWLGSWYHFTKRCNTTPLLSIGIEYARHLHLCIPVSILPFRSLHYSSPLLLLYSLSAILLVSFIPLVQYHHKNFNYYCYYCRYRFHGQYSGGWCNSSDG